MRTAVDRQLVRQGHTWLFSGRSGMRRSEPGGVSGSMLAGPASPCGALWLPCVAESEKGDALGAPAAAIEFYQRACIRQRTSWAHRLQKITSFGLSHQTALEETESRGLQKWLWRV